MATSLDIDDRLNEQQVLMLRLFKDPLPEEDFLQMRRLAVKLLSKKLNQVTEQWEKDHNISEEHYNNLAQGHFRSKS